MEIPRVADNMVSSSEVGMPIGEEEGTSLLYWSLLGASSVMVYLDVSCGSCLKKLNLILLIERTSQAVISLLGQNVSILKNV